MSEESKSSKRGQTRVSRVPRFAGTTIVQTFKIITTADINAAAASARVEIKGNLEKALNELNSALSAYISAENWTLGGSARAWAQYVAKETGRVLIALEQADQDLDDHAADRAAKFLNRSIEASERWDMLNRLASGTIADFRLWRSHTKNKRNFERAPPPLHDTIRHAIYGVKLLNELAKVQGKRHAEAHRANVDEQTLINRLAGAFELATERPATITTNPTAIGGGDGILYGGASLAFLRSILQVFKQRLDGDYDSCEKHCREHLPKFLDAHNERVDTVRARVNELLARPTALPAKLRDRSKQARRNHK